MTAHERNLVRRSERFALVNECKHNMTKKGRFARSFLSTDHPDAKGIVYDYGDCCREVRRMLQKMDAPVREAIRDRRFAEAIKALKDHPTLKRTLRTIRRLAGCDEADYVHVKHWGMHVQTDAKTGAVTLRATFPNIGHVLHNGGSATILVPTHRKDCIVIPQEATYELQNRTFVYRVVDGKTKASAVTLFRQNNGKEYIVDDGLAVGDTIIAEGAGLLREGIVIK